MRNVFNSGTNENGPFTRLLRTIVIRETIIREFDLTLQDGQVTVSEMRTEETPGRLIIRGRIPDHTEEPMIKAIYAWEEENK